MRSECTQYYLIFPGRLLERYSYINCTKEETDVQREKVARPGLHSWQAAKLEFVLRSVQLCFCTIQGCQQVEARGEEKGLFDLSTFSRVVKVQSYFKV